MSGPHKRKSLRSLLQDAKEKMAQSPEHIRAAQVLAEMQEDLHGKMSGVNDRGECPGFLSGENVRGVSENIVSGGFSEDGTDRAPAEDSRVCAVAATDFGGTSPAPISAPDPLTAPLSGRERERPALPSTLSPIGNAGEQPEPHTPAGSANSEGRGWKSEAPSEALHTAPYAESVATDQRKEMSGVNVRGECPGEMSGVSRPEPFPVPCNGSTGQAETPFEATGKEARPPASEAASGPVSDRTNGPAPQWRPLPVPLEKHRATEPTAKPASAPEQGRKRRRETVREILPPRSRITGGRQKHLHAWLMAQGGAVRTTLPLLTEMTGIEDRSLRRILTAWEANGIAEKTSGQFGVEIRLLVREAPAPKKDKPAEELSGLCPTLCAAGFSRSHLTRILAALARQGLDIEAVWTGLRYAEWELAHEQMLDRAGQPVASPVDWVYKSLVSDGTYRIPKGYVSPAERQRRQAEEEMHREREAQEKLRRVREEQEALELQRQADTLFEALLREPESDFAATILQALPRFLRDLGMDNALFQRACRGQIERHLKTLAGMEEQP